MAPTMRKCFRILLGSAFAFLPTLSSSQITGSVRPWDVREAWPVRADVLKPDPVLGTDKLFEIWAYDREFAARFSGVDPAGAVDDLNAGVHAIVFRAYKEKVLEVT